MRIRTFLVIASALLMLGSAVTAHSGWFGKSDEEKKVNVPFPTDDASFNAVQKEYRDRPQDNSLLEFKITLPNDWEKVEMQAISGEKPMYNLTDTQALTAIDRDLPNDLSAYKSPFVKGQTLNLKVQSLRLYNEISAKYWLERYMSLHNLLPLGEIQEVSEKEAYVTYSAMENEVSRNTKVKAIINSNMIILANFSYPTSFEKYTGYIQDKVLNSFALVNPTTEPIEKQENLGLKDAFSFKYPSSWKMYKISDDDPRYMYVQLQNLIEKKEDGSSEMVNQIEGIMEITAIRRRDNTTLMKEINTLKNRIESSMDVSFKTMIDADPIKADGRFMFSRYEAYPAEMKDTSKQNKEVHLVVLGDEKWYVIAFLYTPNKEEDSYLWARNVQSFKSIVKSIK